MKRLMSQAPHGWQLVAAARHPALAIAILVAFGIFTARVVDLSVTRWLWIAACVCLFSSGVIVLVRRPPSILISVSVALIAISLGGVRYASSIYGRPDPGLVELANRERPVELWGEVAGSPEKRLTGWRVPIDLTSVRTRTGTAPLRSTVLLTARRPLDSLHHGDLVRCPARLILPHSRRNPGGFDYAQHLFNKGIDALARPAGGIVRRDHPNGAMSMHRIVEPVREWMRDVFARYLTPIPRALILGFLIGEIGELPPTILHTMRDAGALHLLAVSGANVWLIVGMLLLPMRLAGVRRWPRTIVLLCVVVGFSVLARNEPSVVRASIMIAALLAGTAIHRPVRPLNAVGVAAIIILLLSPLHLMQPGFQLSFAAVISIILVHSRVSRWLARRSRWIRNVLILAFSTGAATIATAPIIAWHFAEVPIVALPANLLLVPLASVCVYLGVAVLLADVVWQGLAMVICVPLSALLSTLLTLARVFAELPVSVIRWPHPSMMTIALIYGPFFAALHWRHRYRFARPAVYIVLVGVIAVSVDAYRQEHEPACRLTLLDAGRTRVALLDNRLTGELRLLTDDPRLTYDLREWILDPFLRTEDLEFSQLTIDDWLTASSESSPVFSRHSYGFQQVRQLSVMPDVATRVRYWADQITVAGHRLTFFRALPTDTIAMSWVKRTCVHSEVVVLPASVPEHLLRRLLTTLTAHDVILYGNEVPHRNARQWFDDLRTHFPDITLWSTPIHGGIRIDCRNTGIRIIPTIANSSWHDASVR